MYVPEQDNTYIFTIATKFGRWTRAFCAQKTRVGEYEAHSVGGRDPYLALEHTYEPADACTLVVVQTMPFLLFHPTVPLLHSRGRLVKSSFHRLLQRPSGGTRSIWCQSPGIPNQGGQ